MLVYLSADSCPGTGRTVDDSKDWAEAEKNAFCAVDCDGPDCKFHFVTGPYDQGGVVTSNKKTTAEDGGTKRKTHHKEVHWSVSLLCCV